MDLAKLKWEAIHTERNAYNYRNINREDLQELRFYKQNTFNQKDIFVVKRPDNISYWNIKWRMRTQIDEGTSEVKERFWIIETNELEKSIYIIRESGDIEFFKNYEECKRKPLGQTPLDET